MYLLFTRSNKLGSRFICWLLGEPMSHVAIQFTSGLVAHASMDSGLRLDWAKQFREDHNVKAMITVAKPPAEELQVMTDLLDRYYKRGYDWQAVAYLGWRGLLRKLLGVPLPRTNPWDRKYLLYCTEWATIVLGMKVDPMMTPFELYRRLASVPTGAEQPGDK